MADSFQSRRDLLVEPASRRPHLVSSPARRSRRSPLELWHLLSLDAPTVAALWTWFLARVCGIRLPGLTVLAMATAVWLLYAADRLLDARALDASALRSADPLEARHRFHHRHRPRFLTGIVLASLTMAALLPSLAPAAVRLYLIEGGFLVGYFVLIHATRSSHRLPKELAVGLFFAAATFIPTVARRPELRLELIAPALLFAALCSLNCVFIYAWEHPLRTPATTHAATRFALRYLRPLAYGIFALSMTLALASHAAPRIIAIPTALATALLLVLDRLRGRMSPTTLRAAADLALLTPLLLLLRLA